MDAETRKIFFEEPAHKDIVNCIDGIGGDIGYY